MRKLTPALALCLVSAAAALLASAGAASAGDPSPTFKTCAGKPSADDEKAARGLFEAGKTAYNEGDYNRAINYWRDAFDRDCTAAPLLLNLANAYEKSGNVDASITSLETYLKRRPDAEDASTIQKRIENMKRARQAAPPVASPAKSAPPPPPTASTTVTSPPPAPPETPSSGPGIAPWIVVGVGGALTITGLIVYTGGKSKITDSENACPNHQCTDPSAAQKGNDGRSQEKLGGILAGVGIAGVAGGLVWYFVAKPSPSQSAFVAPSVAPGFAGLSAGGAF